MRLLTTLFTTLGVTLFVMLGCAEQPAITPPDSVSPELTDRVAMLMGGWPHAKAIIETGKATAFRIGQDDEFNEVMLSDGIALTAEQRQTLVDLLARDDAYEWDIAKGCEPMNGVLVTFEDGATYARLRFCFSCQILEFRPGASEDFDPINVELVEWVKGIFPDDEAIQSLGTDQETPGL